MSKKKSCNINHIDSHRGHIGDFLKERKPYLYSGEALLGAVFDRPSAALRQVAGPVLRLRLHHNLQLLALPLWWVLHRQNPALLDRWWRSICSTAIDTEASTVIYSCMTWVRDSIRQLYLPCWNSGYSDTSQCGIMQLIPYVTRFATVSRKCITRPWMAT